MTDRDVRRETADEIASALDDRSDHITSRSKGLEDGEFWLYVGMARGFKQAAEIATKLGRKDPS